MKKTIWWIAGIIIVILIILALRPAGSKEAVRIGVIAPMTGSRADAGEFVKNALTLAEEQIGRTARYEVDFLIEDSRYEAPTAVSVFRKLTDLDKVKFVIGPGNSSEVMAVGPIAEENKVILMVYGAQSPEISELGDYVFRIIHNSDQEAPMFAAFVASTSKSDTLHFIALNTAITEPYLKAFRPVFESKGKRIGLIEKFDPKDLDFKAQLTKIKAKNPTDIMLIITTKQGAALLKQARDLGIKAQFYNIGIEGPEMLTQSDGAAEGLLYPYSYDNASAEPGVRAFYDAYRSRFGVDPDTLAVNAYDSAMLLSRCFDAVGTDVDAVKGCLYETKDYAGAGGTFSVDGKGDAIKSIFIKTVRSGKFVKVNQ